MEPQTTGEKSASEILEQIENYIEAIIKDADEYYTFSIASPFYRLSGKSISPFKHGEVIRQIRILLEKKYRYATATGKDGISYNITPEGIEAKQHGGHLKYQKFLEEEKIHEKNYKEADRQLKWYEKENAKQKFEDYPTVKKQRNWLFVIAVATILFELIKWLF